MFLDFPEVERQIKTSFFEAKAFKFLEKISLKL